MTMHSRVKRSLRARQGRYRSPALALLRITLVCFLCPLAGRTEFSDQTATVFPGGMDGTVSAVVWGGDYNNDGFVDLITDGAMYRNNGGTNFTDSALGGGGALFGDFDNDGWIDRLQYYGKRVERNNGGTSFTITQSSAAGSGHPDYLEWAQPSGMTGATWGDFTGNGWIDFYACGGAGEYNPDIIFTNAGGRFARAWLQSSGLHYSRGATTCDFDQDGDLDLFVSTYWLEANNLWLNDGSGSGFPFSDVAATRGVAHHDHGLGADWGDLDNDGDFDLAIAALNHGGQPPTAFFRNNGPPSYNFTQVYTAPYSEAYSSPALGDYDNDGDLDVYIAEIYSNAGLGRPVLLRNNGAFSFTDVTLSEGIPDSSGHGAGWADYDNDGDLDLVNGDSRLLRNDLTNGNHWLKVRMRGDGTQVNTAAIGAQVRIAVPGLGTLSRQVHTARGHTSGHATMLHFGLGDHSDPVELEVFWPNGLTQVVDDVAVDRLVDVDLRPLVANGQGATGVTHNAAWLTGNLLFTGGATTDVCVHWGTTTNVLNRECLSGVEPEAFSVGLSGLDPNTLYYYRCVASNVYGQTWASGLERFTTAGVLPFRETFEERVVGDLDYQHGWRATAAGSALVQGHTTHAGSQKACSVSNAAVRHAFTPATPPAVVWINTFLVLQRTEDAGSYLDTRASSPAAAMFVIDGTGCVAVSDGGELSLLTAGPTVATSRWARFTVRLNYVTREWDLWMNTTNVARHLGFHSPTASSFQVFECDGGDPGPPSLLDNVTIGPFRPEDIPMIDDDEDQMDDDLEYFYFGSITNSDGSVTADWDQDGFIDLYELLAGTVPTNPASLLAVSNVLWEGEADFVLKWYSVSNKWYAVLHSSNLLDQAASSTVISNIAATPPFNVETVTVETIPAFYWIMLEQ